MGKYILNQETQKIELHFDKSEYLALSDDQKKEIKSNFLWSRFAGAWVSRSTNNHYWALKVAEKLGLDNGGKEGERLSYAEQLEVKAEKAEHRAERMEEHAGNAEKRAAGLQKELNSFHGDIAFFTQPNINSSRGRAFTNYRNKVYARYEKGFEEYRKSEYFQGRAETARGTASMAQLENPVYLHNRIKECKSTIAKLEKNIVHYEEQLYKVENGEIIKRYNGEVINAEQYTTWITETLEKMEYEIDKLAFFENKLDEIGGNRFSKENIKIGYIVKVRRWGNVEVTGTGPINFTYSHKLGNKENWPGQDPYAAIVEIVEAKADIQEIENPFRPGDILCKERPADNSIYAAYQVIKTTAAGVKLQQIAIDAGAPMPGKFISEKQTQKKIVKSKWSDWTGVYMDDWQLHKYSTEKSKAV